MKRLTIIDLGGFRLIILLLVLALQVPGYGLTIQVTGDYWVTGDPGDIEHLGDQYISFWIDPNPVLSRDWDFDVSVVPTGGPDTAMVSLYASNINEAVSDYLWININGWMTTLNITMPGDYDSVIDDTQTTFKFQSYAFDSSHLFVGTNMLRITSGGGVGFQYDDFEVTGLSIDYEPTPEPPWSFVYMTDTHIGYTEKECRWVPSRLGTGGYWECWEVASASERLAAAIDQILEEVKSGTKIKPDFILVTGDIAEQGNNAFTCSCTMAYKDFILAVKPALNLGIEVITVPGNHDRFVCSNLQCYFGGLIPQGVQVCNEFWSRDYKGLYFIGLDTGGGLIYQGDGFTDPQWQGFITSPAYTSNKPKIIFMHHPAINNSILPDYTFIDHNQDFLDFCRPVNNHNVKLVLAGHTHEDKILDIDKNSLPIGSTTYPQFIQTRSIGKDPPGGYRWINVTYASPPIAHPETSSDIRDDSDRIRASLYSPGSLHMYDSDGEHTGMTTTGEPELSIPRSYYFNHYVVNTDDGDEVLPEKIIVFGQADDYLYEVIGSEAGTYRVEIKSVQEGGEIAFRATDVPTSPGERHIYRVDWAALSAGGEGVTLEIDTDGDGVPERTVIADEDLTAAEFALQTETVIDFDPAVLNLGSRAKVVTVYIELPEGFDVSAIDPSSVKLNDAVPALSKPVQIGDHDIDGIPDLMVKFDCAQVADVVEAGRQTVTLRGRLADGTLFAGTDTIRVIGSSAAATELELESIVPQESAAPRQKKAATAEADAVDTGASEAFDVKEGVAFMLLEACQAISELGPQNFNSEESAIELTTTIDAMFAMLDDGQYFEALAALDNDILRRTDGCANTGQPDEDDWIKSVEGQALVYPLVIETIELLESLI